MAVDTDPTSVLPFVDGDVELSTVCPDFLRSNMRALPLQSRARLTVERILVAGRGIGQQRGFDGLTLDAVATAANVRLGAVYRYFSTPDDLIRIVVRLWIAARYERFRTGLAATQFGTTEGVVEYIAAGVERMLLHIEAEPMVSTRLKRKLMRDYHETPHAELWAMADEIRAAMARGGLNAGSADLQPRLAMAFAGASAFTKTALMNAPQMLTTDYFRDRLRDFFRDALADVAAAQPAAPPALTPG